MPESNKGLGPMHPEDPGDLESGRMPHVESFGPDFKSGANPGDCPICRPYACDDPDNHLGVPSDYTPLKNRGCGHS